MSLIVSQPKTNDFTPLPDGTYLGVCSMIVDLGDMYSETYKKLQRKVMIGWQLPEEPIEVNGKEEPRVVTNRYTATLGESGNLYRDLIAWRGKPFTPEELAAFDLKNIIGASCLLTVATSKTGEKTYTNVTGVAKLLKGMDKGELTGEPLLFNLDTATLADVEALPQWIANQIKKSETYKIMTAAVEPVELKELEDDGELPF